MTKWKNHRGIKVMDKKICEIMKKKTESKWSPLFQFVWFFLLTFLLFANLIKDDSIPVCGDGNIMLNTVSYLRTSILNGEIPFWNKMLSNGRPFTSDLTNSVFYPVELLLLLFDTKEFIYIYYSIHIAFGATFFTKYLKEIGVSNWVSIIASTIYYFSISIGGYRKEHMTLIACTVYLPVLLYLVEKYYHTTEAKYLYISSMLMAFQFMIGFPQFVIYTDLFVGCYIIIMEIKHKFRFAKWFREAFIWGILYIGLIMIQLIPFGELYVTYSKYGSAQTTLEVFKSLSVHPIRLIMMLCPTIFNMDVYNSIPTIGSTGIDAEIFLGTITFVLMIYAVVSHFKSFSVWTSLTFMCGVLVYAMNGCFTVLAKIFYRLPILGSFRVSSRIMFIFYFFGMVLAAIGLDYLIKDKNFKLFRKIIMVFLSFMIVVLVANLNAASGIAVDGSIDYNNIIDKYGKTILVLMIAFLGAFVLPKCTKLSDVGFAFMCVALIIFDVYPYWNDACSQTMTEFGVDTSAEEFLVNNTGQSNVLLASGNADHIMNNFNMSLGFPAINSYTNMNDPRLSLLLTSKDVREPAFNSSGQYMGFPEIEKNLRKDIDILSMLGVKYIIDQENRVPAESELDERTGDITKNIIFEDTVNILASNELVSYAHEIDIESNNIYGISFDCEGYENSTSAIFYVDFYGGEQYDNSMQEKQIIFEPNKEHYSYYFDSGEIPESVTTIYVRLVAQGVSEGLNLKNFSVDLMETQKIKNPYKLQFDEEGIKIYENTNCKDVLYIPQNVKKIDDMDMIYGHNEDYDFSNTSYAENISEFNVSDAEITEVNFKVNSIDAVINATGQTFVNFSQTYYPGWTAYVDGKRTELYEVNGYIQGIVVPEGCHNIRFVFVPRTLIIGSIFSFLSAVLWLWLIFQKKSIQK